MKPYCRKHRNASELPPSENVRAAKYETPFSPDWVHVFETGRRAPEGHRTKRYVNSQRIERTPETEMQALMETEPNYPIPKSVMEGVSERERIVDAIDRLPLRSRWIFDAIALGGRSYREVGRELSLSKTQIDRLYKAALAQLQAELHDMVEEDK